MLLGDVALRQQIGTLNPDSLPLPSRPTRYLILVPHPLSVIWLQPVKPVEAKLLSPIVPHSLSSLSGSEIQIFTTTSRNRGFNGSLWSITVHGRNIFLWVGDSSAEDSPAFLAARDYAGFAAR